MTKNTIFQDSFLISGIMCHAGCGYIIQDCLNECLVECKKELLLPDSAQLSLYAEPEALGVHLFTLTIESDTQEYKLTDEQNQLILAKLKKSIILYPQFQITDNLHNGKKEQSNHVNWINILINLASITVIMVLSTIFSPSLPLTIGLTALSLSSATFTAREYLVIFFQNLRHKNLANMATTISLGWLLSLTHTLYHSITMPLASSFSMVFMNFIMPVILITIINGMDEIKRVVLDKSKKMHLHGITTLLPEMAEAYDCYSITQQKQEAISQLITNKHIEPLQTILEEVIPIETKKNALTKGMIINIKSGDCFPVDCIVIKGNTLVNTSISTGRLYESKQCLDLVPAGAINLGQSVTVYAIEDAYHSAVNQLLFRAHRADKKNTPESNHLFIYLYTGLIVTEIAASIGIPLALGIISIPLLLQNITGILFSLCPCTMVIAHQLPNLLSNYQRSNKGIILRQGNSSRQLDKIHTVVFDKTGTLTTGNSEVDSSEGISSELLERMYLLETHAGAEHPIAKAIINHYKTNATQPILFKDITTVDADSKNRGLSGVVQGNQIHIGNADYLRQSGIKLPEINTLKIEQGLSPVYVAENNRYKGVVYIKHEIRKNILPSLRRLKKDGIRIMMLTGDNTLAATGFDQQIGRLFNSDHIKAEQTPQMKEQFLSQLTRGEDQHLKGVWFVGDGLNDALCARTVSEKGGVSCSMTRDDKTAFFTDISLNESLDYLFEHKNLNDFLEKNVLQNQGLLAYGSIVFLAFIVNCSISGCAVSPLIPLLAMASTTLLVLFNSFRVSLAIDNALDKKISWLKQLLASDLSIGLLVGSSMLFVASGLGLPAIVIATGAALLSAAGLISTAYFAGVSGASPSINHDEGGDKDKGRSPSAPPARTGFDPNPNVQPSNLQTVKTTATVQSLLPNRPASEQSPLFSIFSINIKR